MKRMLSYILVGFVFIFFSGFKHPYYLSVTEMRYNSTEKALEGSVKIFVSDLEIALKKINKQPVDLLNGKESQIKGYLSSYLFDHLKFTINGQAKKYDLLGFEVEEEGIYLYIELKKCERPHKIEVDDSILYDLLSEQMNIVHIEVLGKKKSTKVLNPEIKASFLF